ncbi:hypothetical protein DFH08DRAFT_333220 [Mycena albidolilacea]|uniref:Uncharacterized protein n=1 Tax=Mycena albidolilacea TaxID=1033008 RepID=A0AAD7EI65_9AGAR|nr:hypothetical protein DFH08DRAFT_333220 [Mycena albidolilacea]
MGALAQQVLPGSTDTAGAFLYALASLPRCRTTPAGGAACSRSTPPSTSMRRYCRSRCPSKAQTSTARRGQSGGGPAPSRAHDSPSALHCYPPLHARLHIVLAQQSHVRVPTPPWRPRPKDEAKEEGRRVSDLPRPPARGPMLLAPGVQPGPWMSIIRCTSSWIQPGTSTPHRHRPKILRIFSYRSQVTGGIYEYFKQVTKSPENGPKIEFFASVPPACETAPQYSHEVPVLSFSGLSGIFSLSGRPAIAATMSETRKLQYLCEQMMSEPILESQVKEDKCVTLDLTQIRKVNFVRRGHRSQVGTN